jgi:hypothetical protein
LRDDRFGLAAGFADARRIVARKGALLALGMPTNAGGTQRPQLVKADSIRTVHFEPFMTHSCQSSGKFAVMHNAVFLPPVW